MSDDEQKKIAKEALEQARKAQDQAQKALEQIEQSTDQSRPTPPGIPTAASSPDPPPAPSLDTASNQSDNVKQQVKEVVAAVSQSGEQATKAAEELHTKSK